VNLAVTQRSVSRKNPECGSHYIENLTGWRFLSRWISDQS
jgi:hypothetical protein